MKRRLGLPRPSSPTPSPGSASTGRLRWCPRSWLSLASPTRTGIAITGIKGVIDTGRKGPTVAIMGELDSHIVPGHAHADPQTGAAHACGHHCQIGSMLAAAMGLKAEGVLEHLTGRVVLIAVPAEEYIEIEFRERLRAEGKLEFLAGKPEFIAKGALDDVDIAMMTHTKTPLDDVAIEVGGSNNGMVAKLIQFEGKAAHAGAAPHQGINALNGANIAMSAIHAQRETYRDEDTIRIHPIITRGGASVSSVPSDVRMETFVRGRTVEAVAAANRKVDRALRAGAMAVGGSVTIKTLAGYLPIQHSAPLLDLYTANANEPRRPPEGGAPGTPDGLDRHGRRVPAHAGHTSVRGRDHRLRPRRRPDRRGLRAWCGDGREGDGDDRR